MPSILGRPPIQSFLNGAAGSTTIIVPPLLNQYSGQFNGGSLYSNIGTQYNIQRTQPFSWVFFIKCSAISSYTTIFTNKQETVGAVPGYSLELFPGGMYLSMVHDYPSSATEVTCSGITVDNNLWHCLVWTYDGSSSGAGWKFYVDGVSISTTVSVDTLNASITNANNGYFGYDAIGAQTPYVGKMDEISFWNIALNATQVSTVYNQCNPQDLTLLSFSSALQSWWRLGDSVGDNSSTTIDVKGVANMTWNGTETYSTDRI